MIYITQLIYLKPGQEAIFDQFESIAIPIISQYNGKLLLRLRPSTHKDIIESHMEIPYELHIISFESESDFSDFMADETRKQFLHLKEQSIRTSLIIKGVGL